ncbi:hypothetical protein H920_05069 [Fukomys damarensis]|uniref:Uncharacterized protein n=1 Tax=Fukomys damarensis TaxID=885580 RepID=A0A091DR06_FUKDA|nr:hypothetical protein H920_05069 [Fukomys damarensis]
MPWKGLSHSRLHSQVVRCERPPEFRGHEQRGDFGAEHNSQPGWNRDILEHCTESLSGNKAEKCGQMRKQTPVAWLGTAGDTSSPDNIFLGTYCTPAVIGGPKQTERNKLQIPVRDTPYHLYFSRADNYLGTRTVLIMSLRSKGSQDLSLRHSPRVYTAFCLW